MWARNVETMLAVWLAISPAIFRGPEADVSLWAIDLAAAAVVALLALLSYWPPTQYAHLGIVLVGLALIAAGWIEATSHAPTDQNHVVLGLLLLMFAIIPNAASCPPAGWGEFEEAD